MTQGYRPRERLKPAPAAPVDDLFVLADLTLAEFLRHLARYGGTVLEEDGLLLFGGTHRQPNPYRNGALCLDNRLSPQEVLERTHAFFSARQSGYVVWVREHADTDLGEEVQRRGMREIERLPEMVLEQLPPERPPPDGIVLRRTTDEATRRDYVRVVAEAWGMEDAPLDVASAVFFDPESVAAPHVAAFVAYEDGAPLSGAMTLVSHGAALGTQGGTLRRARRRGLAQSCLWAALRISFEEMGVKRSVCQTSVVGQPAWEGLGYVPFTGYRRFLGTPASGASRPRTAAR